ncbi:MAG: GGDEF domain-containing protein [Desulfovibrio sp.]
MRRRSGRGQLSLEDIDDPEIVRIYHLLRGESGKEKEDVRVVEDKKGGNYLLTFTLPGPDWWFVMVYPKSLIIRDAHQTSRIVLLLGVSLFVLYYLVIFVVTNQQVRDPLRRMLRAISLVGDKRYDELAEHPEILPVERKNEMGQLARAFLRMVRQVRDFNRDLESVVESRTRELERANARLRALSLLDGLTGIYNRRSFDRDIGLVFAEAKRGVDSFCLLMADVDSFKKYNDSQGHAAGDEALRNIAQRIAETIRHQDRVYRFGGEELAVIFNNAGRETTRPVGQRVLDSVRGLNMAHAGSAHGVVTISAGLVEFSPDFESAVDMIRAADALLYAAKARGGDCIVDFLEKTGQGRSDE